MSDMYDRRNIDDYEKIAPTTEEPWGQREPEGGFQVGDYVALAYSDHEEYVFDNPVGFVVAVEPLDPDDEEFGDVQVTVEVQGTIGADRVSLLARPKAKTT